MTDLARTRGLTDQAQANLILVWHLVLGLGGLAAAAQAWLPTVAPAPLWQRLGWTALGLLVAVASALTVAALRRRQHRARWLGLVLNYLGFAACLIFLLHFLGIFTGIDSLADTFGRGLPWLLLAFGAYLLSAFGDQARERASPGASLKLVGQLGVLGFGLAFLYAVGVVPGTVSMLSRLINPLHLALLAGLISFGLAAATLWRPRMAEYLRARNHHEEHLNGYLFLSPNLIGFLLFFAGPLVFSLFVSFTDWDAFGTKNWVGLENYVRILTLDLEQLATPDQPASEVLDVTTFSELSRFSLFGRHFLLGATDKLFWISLRNTIVFVLFALPLSVIPALFLSTLLNSKLPGMRFFRAVYFLPSVAAVVGIALIWQLLYNATIGYINYGITSAVGLLNQILPGTLADPGIRWLSDSQTALLSIVIIFAWQTIGFNTVLFLAGLQNIPGVLYEAATVDGAGRWAQFWNVTLPLLAPATFFVVTTTTIQAMQVFDQIFVVINPPEGPNNATLSMVLYLYRSGFQNFRQGYGSAIAWVLFFLIFGITLLQFQRQRLSSGLE